MKNTLFISFMFFLLVNKITAYEAEKDSLYFFLGDSLKIKSTHSIDTLKNLSSDSLKIVPVKKNLLIKEQGLIDSTFTDNILFKHNLNKTDYRFIGNFISQNHFGFLRDFGSVGQLNEIMIYGNGFNNSTYLSDGLNITNRLTNSYDLNLFQSESIDRIEIVPFVQGFLYGSQNNPVAVNFVSSEFEGNIPYTRIKFYQGIYDEGFFDGIFNSTFGKRLGVFAELTNHSTEPRYVNSGHSAWLVTTRLRYLFSEKINLTAGYRYAKTNTQLYGGIDLDSVNNSYAAENVEEILYNNLQAPVNYINRYQKITSHNFYIKALADIIPGSPTSLTFYYQDVLNEFRQNDSTSKSNLQNGVASITSNNSYKTFGMNFDQRVKLDFISLRTNAGYEQNTFSTPHILKDSGINSAWLSAQIKLSLLDNKITPSFFAKYLKYDNSILSGYGADFLYRISSTLNIYTGYSEFERPGNILLPNPSNEKLTSKNFEAAVSYKNEMFNVRSGFFSSSSINAAIPVFIKNIDRNNTKNESVIFLRNEDIATSGVNVMMGISFWKLLITTNSSYYFSEDDRDINGLPEFTLQGGIYYVDTLFNNNLKLKAGINYSSLGSRNNLYYDFEKNLSTTFAGKIDPASGSIQYLQRNIINSDFQLDFFVSGQIQNNATIYFTFENFLNNKYYIIPYYPMYERGIRLGVAWEFFN